MDFPILVLADTTAWLVGAGALIAGAVLGAIGIRAINAKRVGAAMAEAKDVMSKAQAEAKAAADQIRLEADKVVLERKQKAESEIESKRHEIREDEKRLAKREDLVDRKDEMISNTCTTLNPAARERPIASWIAGPSASGSENGKPISKTSAPALHSL